MTPERLRQVEKIFQGAVACETRERPAYLDRVCGKDTELRQEVEALLACDESQPEFLEQPAVVAAAEWLSPSSGTSLIGRRIGPYQILQEIGRGGMGEVYLAEDTKLARKVAIKFLTSTFAGDEKAQNRLIREAQAAAKLDHPNICTVYEVGEVDQHSFIVMQNVEGDTLARRIQQQSISLPQTVDIAMQVAEALVEAHAHKIVHRDIKPQNIMLTPRGQVKVLDFGIAKVMEQPPTLRNKADTERILTEAGIMVGTPPYMSPEQAKLEPIDARSDLFSLGALLYECAAGRPAFSGNSPIEICTQVIQYNPPPPSQFNPRIPAELDRLILKALAKSPEARYQSADELLAELYEIRVQMDGKVQTRNQAAFPAADILEVRRLISIAKLRRRPLVFIFVPLLALAIILSIYLRSHGVPQLPPAEAKRWYELGAEAMRDGAYYKASQALERAIQLDDKFVLAHARLAEAWTEMDYADKAKDELLRITVLVPNLSILPPIPALYLQATTLVVTRDFAGAINKYQEILRLSPNDPRTYVDLGRVYEKNEETDKAIECHLKAASRDPEYATAFLRLGILYGRKQVMTKAAAAFEKAETLYQASSADEGRAEVFYQRGVLFNNRDKLSEAKSQLQKALDMMRRTNNEYQQIRTLLQLSSVSALEGNVEQGQQYASKAVDLAQANGREHLTTTGLIDLGNIFYLRGDYNEAEKYFMQALDFAQRYKGRQNEARALLSLGSLRVQQGMGNEAIRYIKPALAFYQQGKYGKTTYQALLLLGNANRQRGDYGAARQAFDQQLQLAEKMGDQSDAALSHAHIAKLLGDQEQYSEALRHFEKSYTISKSMGNPWTAGYALASSGSMLWQLGRYEAARTALNQASDIAGNLEGSKQLMALIKLKEARMELSLQHFKAAIRRSKESFVLAVPQYKDIAVQAKSTHGLALALSGEWRQGKLFCEQAIEMATGTGDPRLLSLAQLTLAEVLLKGGDTQSASITTLKAQEGFAHLGLEDSEWRSWLVAAQASQRGGNNTMARKYALQAADRLSNLQHKWGVENYKHYLARPDIQSYQKQLNQVYLTNH